PSPRGSRRRSSAGDAGVSRGGDRTPPPETVLGEREEFSRSLDEQALPDQTIDGLRESLFILLAARPNEETEGKLGSEHGGDVERSLRFRVQGRKVRSRRASHFRGRDGPTV